MSGTTFLGVLLIVGGLLFITAITWISRSTIERIHRRGPGTAREILQDKKDVG